MAGVDHDRGVDRAASLPRTGPRPRRCRARRTAAACAAPWPRPPGRAARWPGRGRPIATTRCRRCCPGVAIVTARPSAASRSATDTPMGPPIGSHTSTGPSGSGSPASDLRGGAHDRGRARAIPGLAASRAGGDHHRIVAHVAGADLATELDLDPGASALGFEPVDDQRQPFATGTGRRDAASRPGPAVSLDDAHGVPADRRDARRLQPGRTGADDRSPSVATTTVPPVSSGSVSSWPVRRIDDARHDRVACVAHLARLVAEDAGPDCVRAHRRRASRTSAASASSARVISTPSHGHLRRRPTRPGRRRPSSPARTPGSGRRGRRAPALGPSRRGRG